MLRLTTFLLIAFAVGAFCQGLGVGMLGEEKAADKEVMDMVKQIRPRFEKLMERTYNEFTPIKYRTQTVAGVNYFIKIRVAPEEYIHLGVRTGIADEKPRIFGMLKDKTLTDPIEHFPRTEQFKDE